MTFAARIPRTVIRARRKPDPRRSAAHLAFVRQLPCLSCGASAPSQAAHVRASKDAGTGTKPGDRYTVPLCALCHHQQHQIGETAFFGALGIDALNISLRLWTVSGDIDAGRRVIFRARQSIDLKKNR